ncbi:MAG TPA: ecotin [Epsilonproteobacteria bacterium]|nr:ecotin [Campylobacterota bacterium]
MAVALAGSSLYAEPAKKDNIHMFPQAEEGFVRHVIEVPKTDNDYEHKVELLIGKVMLVDCNKHSLMGKVESVTLKGWGYKYLEVTDIQSGPSTLMACKEPKTEKFILIRDTLRRYNSRFPIVAYVPEGYEVRYRIWSADDNIQQATQR